MGPHFIQLLHGFPQAKVTVGEDVIAAQGKDQEHLGRPNADPFHCGQVFDDLRVRPRGHPFEIYCSVQNFLREVFNETHFHSRKSCAPHFGYRNF